MTSTTLPQDPAPGITPTPAVEIRTDVWNQMVDILNGVSSEHINVKQPVVAKVGSYIATLDDFLVTGDASGGAFSITLPSAAAAGVVGKIMAFKKIDSSGLKVTIDGDGTETIDGKLTIGLETENEILMIQSDGTNWVIIANYLAVIDNGLLKIRNPAGTFAIAVKTSADVANRSATIPLLGADDTFVMVNLAQNLRAKQMYDSNGLEVLLFVGVSSAVNEITVTNAITTANPILAPTGDDANVGINIPVKGTGKHVIGPSSIDIAGILGLPSTEISIATGALPATVALISVDAEGAPTTDTLVTITGLSDGDIVGLVAKASNVITVTHDSGGADSIHLTDKIDIELSETVPLFLIRQGGEFYQFAGPQVTKVILALGKPADALATGDLQVDYPVTEKGVLIKVKATVQTVSSSGLPTFAIRKDDGTPSEMLSTNLTIDASEKTSETATTPAVIDAAERSVDPVTDDRILIDVDVAGTGTLGAIITLWFLSLSDE